MNSPVNQIFVPLVFVKGVFAVVQNTMFPTVSSALDHAKSLMEKKI